MSLAQLYSRARNGIQAPLVNVEVHLANGMPGLAIVGLPEKAVQESKDRVRGAIINSGFSFPIQRITVNLAPADLPKEGGCYDLPIALGILAASGQVPRAGIGDVEFMGELALSGQLRPIKGVLPAALAARGQGRSLIVPQENLAEAALVSELERFGADSLLAVCQHMSGHQPLPWQEIEPVGRGLQVADLLEVKGQPQAKRALEVAASGGHSLLFLGPPGSGKSMLAQRLPGILPPMTEAEALETASIHSVSNNGFDIGDWARRPYRAPHHSASGPALVGGGGNPRPGEISLAHNGVLFLDELPEFDRKVLEVLREPLENGHITISRAARSADFPARFQLIAAMNPCPCGYLGDSERRCACSQEQVRRYRARISGPLLDRIDMHVEAPRLPPDLLLQAQADGETSAQVRQRVLAARQRQLERAGKANAALGPAEIQRHCALDPASGQLLQDAIRRLGLSARAYHRILKVARTAADLAASPAIQAAHIAEAIGYRRLDRQA
ncbi:YifB family Mg chelatase-like AAA ATPase [Magnetovirga frankeli]|uniref:YifB family Mg chelatase-like AAA ATPase n=1 Tax=Magnetovirga frankeli TaxID=947516 RepID=UPI001293ECA0|nr:YifB family Mg chelatase-like AAA ATPase [gamma proteobacterium SS-5]